MMNTYQSTKTIQAQPYDSTMATGTTYFPVHGEVPYIHLSGVDFPIVPGKDFMVVKDCCASYLIEKSEFISKFEYRA